MRALVVYYSRTGTTRALAQSVSRSLKADLEEIRVIENRLGFRGYLRSCVDGAFGRCAGLEPTRHHPCNYDVVVIGTPVWSAGMSAPVRTFLAANGSSFRSCAFFATHGDGGGIRALRQMREFVIDAPLTTLVVTRSEVERDSLGTAVDSFVRAITAQVGPTKVNAISLSSPAAT